MGKIAFTLVLLVSLLSFATSSFAAPTAGTGVQVKFSSSPVGAVSWYPAVAATVRGVVGVSILNTSAVPLELGVAYAGAAANSETRQLIVPAGLAPVYYPLTLGYGVRVSVRTVGTSGDVSTTGEVDLNLIYN
jgi:hypothetical protein